MVLPPSTPTAATEISFSIKHTILMIRGGCPGHRDLGILFNAAPWTQVNHGTGHQEYQSPWKQCHMVLPPSTPTATTEISFFINHPIAMLVSRGGSLGHRDLGMLFKAAPRTQVNHGTGQQGCQRPGKQCYMVLPPSSPTATTDRRFSIKNTI